jgi:hypothetical protein
MIAMTTPKHSNEQTRACKKRNIRIRFHGKVRTFAPELHIRVITSKHSK